MLDWETFGSRDELVELFTRYLGALYASMWGRAFSTDSEADRRKAAEWAIDQFLGMIAFEERELQDG